MTEQLDVSKPAKAQYAMCFGPRAYTDSQSAFIDEVVSERQDLTEPPLPLGNAHPNCYSSREEAISAAPDCWGYKVVRRCWWCGRWTFDGKEFVMRHVLAAEPMGKRNSASQKVQDAIRARREEERRQQERNRKASARLSLSYGPPDGMLWDLD